MSRPIAYDPQPDTMYQILVACPGERTYEHCDYADDRADLRHLLENYRLAYGPGFAFKTILLPRRFWPSK